MRFSDDLAHYLRVPLLAALGDEPLRFLAFTAQKRRIDEGRSLFHTGDHAAAAFLIIDGRIELSGAAGLAPKVVGTGTLIGETSLLAAGERPCNAIAVRDTDYIIIGRDDFRRVLSEFPDAAIGVQKHLQAQVADMNRDLRRLTATFEH